jgi:CO dehydrogenase/acetyl-CoA synthase beta subunit
MVKMSINAVKMCLLQGLMRHYNRLYVIQFVSDLRQDGGFRRVLWFPPPIKLTVMI